MKTQIELVENEQGLLVLPEKSYEEARDRIPRYLEGTYLKQLRKHYPREKNVLVKVGERPSDEGLLIYENLIYARWGKRAVVLDLYVPAEHEGPIPVVVWVHGGGWQWGSHRNYRAAAMKLAKRGLTGSQQDLCQRHLQRRLHELHAGGGKTARVQSRSLGDRHDERAHLETPGEDPTRANPANLGPGR